MRRLLSCLVVLLLGMTVPAMAQITYHAPRDPGDGVSPFVGGGVDWSDVSSVIWYGPADRWIMTEQSNKFYIFNPDGSKATIWQTDPETCLGAANQTEGMTTVSPEGGTYEDVVCVQNEDDPGLCCIGAADILNGGSVTWSSETMWGTCSVAATTDCNSDDDCPGEEVCENSLSAANNHEGLAFVPQASSTGRYGGYFYTAVQNTAAIYRYELHATGNYFTYIDSKTMPSGCSLDEIAAIDYDYDTERLYVYADASDDEYCVLDKNITTHYATVSAPPSRCSNDISELCSETCTSGGCKLWGIEAIAIGDGYFMIGDDKTGATNDAYNGLFLYEDLYGGCVTGNDCDDDSACTTDTCSSGSCVFTLSESCGTINDCTCGPDGSTATCAGGSCSYEIDDIVIEDEDTQGSKHIYFFFAGEHDDPDNEWAVKITDTDDDIDCLPAYMQGDGTLGVFPVFKTVSDWCEDDPSAECSGYSFLWPGSREIVPGRDDYLIEIVHKDSRLEVGPYMDQTNSTFAYGDADGDGDADANDVYLVEYCYVNEIADCDYYPPHFQYTDLAAGDANHKVDSRDYAAVLDAADSGSYPDANPCVGVYNAPAYIPDRDFEVTILASDTTPAQSSTFEVFAYVEDVEDLRSAEIALDVAKLNGAREAGSITLTDVTVNDAYFNYLFYGSADDLTLADDSSSTTGRAVAMLDAGVTGKTSSNKFYVATFEFTTSSDCWSTWVVSIDGDGTLLLGDGSQTKEITPTIGAGVGINCNPFN